MRNWSLGGSVLMETQSGGLEELMPTEKVRYHFFLKKKVPSLLTMVKGYIIILNLNSEKDK